MPGNSPQEAVEAFLLPLQRAIGCLGQNKITLSPGGRGQLGRTHAWTLNGDHGVTRKGGWHFEAQMYYEIITDERPGYGPYRVTTRAYRYRIARSAVDIARIHWHPKGKSDEKRPHLHLALNIDPGKWRPGDPMPDTIKEHLPSGRMTLEDAVGWAISLGMPTVRDDWATVLAECQAPHLQYRSWSQDPTEAATI